MSMLCEKCRNVAFQPLDDLGLLLRPGVENDLHHKTWQAAQYYLHYPTLQQLEQSKKDCHLCALMFGSLEVRPHRKSWLECNEDQVFLSFQKARGWTIDPDPLQFDIEVWAGFSMGYLMAKVYPDENWESADWHKKYLTTSNQYDSTGSPNTTSLARQWIRDCNQDHHCEPSEGSMPLLPTRVIDVIPHSNGAIKLHEPPSGTRGNYVTLSYCWGDQRKINFLKTKKDNIATHLQALPSQLHATLGDAIQVTRDLGFRYIWIDALCIIQDDKLDTDREIGKMGQIYQSSSLTIAAASGDDVTSGLLAQRDSFLYRPCFLTVEWEGKLHRTYVHSFPLRHPVALETRLWVLQEQILSPRTLVFRRNYVEWRCSQGHTPEFIPSGLVSERPASNFIGMRAFITRHDDGVKDFPYDEWYKTVAELTARQATVLSDQLPGIVGVASILHEQCKLNDPSQYVAGLWRKDMFAGLTWVRRRSPEFRHGRVKTDENKATASSEPPDPVVGSTPNGQYIAPTWSWAGRPGGLVSFPTSYQMLDDSDLRQCERMITIEEIACEPENPQLNPFGKVKAGAFLTVRGKLKEAITGPTRYAYRFEDRLMGLPTGDDTDLVAGVFDATNTNILEHSKLVGLITFDVLQDRCAFPKILCLPVLKLDPSWDSRVTMICLALTRDGDKYQRIGFVGIFRPRRVIERFHGSSRYINFEEKRRGDVYWDDGVWDTILESTIKIF
ncbi:hypothetical protein FDECE_11958 [Fusarium decemcellulare]|nr:hypothetical protein FDECE_11958 [Fusarium decemcellulare]